MTPEKAVRESEDYKVLLDICLHARQQLRDNVSITQCNRPWRKRWLRLVVIPFENTVIVDIQYDTSDAGNEFNKKGTRPFIIMRVVMANSHGPRPWKSSEVELNSADKRPVNVGASDFATTMNYLYVVGRVLARDLRIKKYILGGVN